MKNLLYIFADQWRYHAIGYAREDNVKTPEMDDFASSSLFCTGAVSTYPLCSPHRAALLTGKHPLNAGFYTNCKIGIRDRITLSPNEITISDILYEKGYQNAYIGKYHLDESEMNYSPSPLSGASNWDAYTPPGERRHHNEFWYSYGAWDNHLAPHYWTDSGKMIKRQGWSPEIETDVLLSFLEKRDMSRPFSVFLSWNPPHPPYDKVPEKYFSMISEEDEIFRNNVPEEWRKDETFRKKRREYYAAVMGLDHEFGRIIRYLKDNGLYDDTIIVLSSDHGDCMGSHGLYGKNIWYDESVRIPLVIHDGIHSGDYDGIIMSEDQMPTLLSLLGFDSPSTVEGLSHSDAFDDRSIEVREYSEHCMLPGLPELVEPFSRLGLDNKAYGWRAVRTKKETYVVNNFTEPGKKRERYYYDNVNDPYQMRPEIVDAASDTARHFDEILRKEFEKTKDNFLLERQ